MLGREACQAWVADTGPLEFLKDPWRLDKVGSPSVSRQLSDVRSPQFTGHKLAREDYRQVRFGHLKYVCE